MYLSVCVLIPACMRGCECVCARTVVSFTLLLSALILDLQNTSITSELFFFFFKTKQRAWSLLFTPQSSRLTSMSQFNTSTQVTDSSNLPFVLPGPRLVVTAGRAHLSLTPSPLLLLIFFFFKETKTLRSKRPYHPIWSLPWREARRIRVQEPDLRSLRPSCLVCAVGVSGQAVHVSSCQGHCLRSGVTNPDRLTSVSAQHWNVLCGL